MSLFINNKDSRIKASLKNLKNLRLRINHVTTHTCGSLTVLLQKEIQLGYEHKNILCTPRDKEPHIPFGIFSFISPTNKDNQLYWFFWHQSGKYIFIRYFRFQKDTWYKKRVPVREGDFFVYWFICNLCWYVEYIGRTSGSGLHLYC